MLPCVVHLHRILLAPEEQLDQPPRIVCLIGGAAGHIQVGLKHYSAEKRTGTFQVLHIYAVRPMGGHIQDLLVQCYRGVSERVVPDLLSVLDPRGLLALHALLSGQQFIEDAERKLIDRTAVAFDRKKIVQILVLFDRFLQRHV